MIKKIILFFDTVKYLKPKQIYFRLFYFARARYRKLTGFKYQFFKDSRSISLKLINSINSYDSYNDSKFIFLNLSKYFDNKIDWNFNEFGKLWTYNITYFEFLNQQNIKKDIGLELINDFINNSNNIKDGFEPFPISLRAINWVKFITSHNIKDKNIDNSLYSQYYILIDKLEYHLLGNHLLENGFSLLFGAYYFQDQIIYKRAKDILEYELEEQILDDGAHFELSPMYHQIMLFRVLDCINLIQNNNWKNQELLKFFIFKAELMLGWLKQITYKNGDIPLLNDSANKITPTSNELFNYANLLKVNIKNIILNKSGYRKILKEKYECIIDIGDIEASYIAGHTHADTFNFEIYINNKPFIVDTGLSTYETNERRNYEKATLSHNTVEINKKNSSEVWGGFRVADRARVIEVTENINSIKATHDGYIKKLNVLHTREWQFEDDKIIIDDSLNKECDAIARLHFHPNISKKEILNKLSIQNSKFKIQNYNYAEEFNKIQKALVLEIAFRKDFKVEINI